MPTPFSLKLATLLAGVLLGYGVARIRQPGRESVTAASATAAATGTSVSGATASTHGEARQLKAVLSHSTEREALLWLRLRSDEFSPDDFKAAATDVMSAGAGRYETLFLELLENWARVAPLEALTFARSLPSGMQQPAFSSIATGWAAADPDGLIAWCQQQETLEEAAHSAIVSALAATRPDAAFAMIGKPRNESGKADYSSFLYRLAIETPARALEFFGRLSEAEQRDSINSLLYGWNMTDPDAPMAWLAALPKGVLREKGYLGTIHTMASTSPREAAELALRELGSSETASSAAYYVIQQWVESDPAEAARFFEGQPDSSFKKKALKRIDHELATREPLAYLDRRVEQQSFAPDDVQELSRAAETLFKRDPAAFESWFRKNWASIPSSQLSNLLSGPSQENPELTAPLLRLLPESQSIDYAYQALGFNWAEKDMSGARSFLQSLPAGPARDRFQIALIVSTAATDLPGTLKEATQFTDPSMQEPLLSLILSHNRDFDTVATWVQSRPVEKGTSILYETLVSRWADHDVQAAGGWVAALPEGALRETMIRTYATQIAGNQPQTAIEWAGKIRDGKEREQALATIILRWSHVDKEAAAAWVAKSTLPEKTKQLYLKEALIK